MNTNMLGTTGISASEASRIANLIKERIKDVISEEFSIHELNLLKEMIKNKEL